MKLYNIADDVLNCAKWHREQHHSRETIVDCIFYGLYESKHNESIPLALIWLEGRDIDAELSELAEMVTNDIFSGKVYRDTESGKILTETQLEAEFEALKEGQPEEYNYTFNQYLRNSTSKNGFLEAIYKQ